jgi:hypothetical protein
VADDFPLIVKGTIDKLVSDKCTALQGLFPGLQWAEVDDMLQTDAVFKAEGPALLWQFGAYTPDPRAPLYSIEFSVGARTVADPGNYTLIDLVSQVRDVFKADQEFQLYNYILASTAPADTVSKGFVRVVSNEISPQMFDRMSGIRYAVVRAKAVRYG